MQRKKAKEKRMSHSLNSRWSKYNKRKKRKEIPLPILDYSATQATFIRQQTNFDRLKNLTGHFVHTSPLDLLFLLCSHRTLNDQASKFSYYYGRSVLKGHLNARIYNRSKCVRCRVKEASVKRRKEKPSLWLFLFSCGFFFLQESKRRSWCQESKAGRNGGWLWRCCAEKGFWKTWGPV